MTDIGKKVEHVTSAKQTRMHHCHWPGCERQVPPAMWGCFTHWMRLPITLRRKVWKTYEIGQEVTQKPSEAYIAVALEIQAWIKKNHPTN